MGPNLYYLYLWFNKILASQILVTYFISLEVSSLDLVNSNQVALHVKDWILDTLTALSQNNQCANLSSQGLAYS